jgi:Ice-binding-like/Bacterial Ig-like domain
MKTNKLLIILVVFCITAVTTIVGCKKDNSDTSKVLPTVISTDASNNATEVVLNKVVSATFSVPMDQATMTATTFTIMMDTDPVDGIVTYTGSTASFTPSVDLLSGITYTATITTGAKDVAGSSLAKNYVWSFTTLTIPNVIIVQGPVVGTVPLAGASNFAILGGSAITNTGATSITGDIGLSPGSSIGGFPPGILTGTQHINDNIVIQAKLDLTTAFNDAAARTSTDIVTLSGNIGGLTLSPGLYKSTSSLAISSGDLTFDAKGNADAIFVIQIASSLTTTSGRKVFLAGGALASNIFWMVGSSVTFGTTSVFKGTVLAMQSITFNTGATLDGRALARTGGITMAGNTIVKQ